MRPSYYIVLLLAIALGISTVRAQREANTWYFGYGAGIDFNSSEPSPITNGQLNTAEGSASISDTNGHILFYTDGTSVWNCEHHIMPNGNDLFGHSSSSQSGVIVPLPETTNLYYIFTVDMQAGAHGLCYSVVDMNLDEGRGDISQKNITLFNPASEKITAIKHANGEDYWIITHEWGSQHFRAYLLTAAGLADTPVFSSVGAVHGGNLGNTIGCMKASSNGDYLALAIYGDGIFEIFNFDDQTGELANPITLTGYNAAYGVEFSADGQYLYGTSFTEKKIYQFNLAYTSAAQMKANAQTVGTSASYLGSIQLAPDGRLYVARFNSSSLARVEYPELMGNFTTFSDEGLTLAGRSSSIGLPSYVQSYFSSPLGKPLPVQVWTFQAEYLQSYRVGISWKNPHVNASFTIEKSTDGKHYEPIAQLEATEGNCYLEDAHAYESAYYRLKEMCIGYERMSLPVYVNVEEASRPLSFKFYPNPIQREVKVEHNLSTASDVTTLLYNQNGQLIWQYRGNIEGLTDAAQAFIPNLDKGNYLVKFVSEDYQETQKLIKY